MAEQTLANDPNVLRRWLGSELRRSREALNLTQRDAAYALEWSLSKLIRIEKGEHAVSVSDLKSMIDEYKITDERQVAALMTAARGSRGPAWWSRYRDVVTPQFARYLGYEGMAASVQVFHPYLVPGLLQTEEYATELVKVLPDQGAARRLVKLKMERQERVFAQPGLSATFIMGEEALYRLIGGRGVMRHQLEHLADLGGRENIEFRMVPFGAGTYAGLLGAFIMLRLLETDEDVLYQESVGGDRIIRDDSEIISRHKEYFETMIDISLRLEQGSALLRKNIDRLRRSERPDDVGSGSR